MGSNTTHLRPRRPCSGNDITQEERNSILRNCARGATRRHEKTMAKRSQRISPVEINAECPHRAKQEVVIKTSRKVRQGLDQEGARDGTGERLPIWQQTAEHTRGRHHRQQRLQSRKEPATPQPFWPWLRPRGTAPSASEHAEKHGTGVRTPRC